MQRPAAPEHWLSLQHVPLIKLVSVGQKLKPGCMQPFLQTAELEIPV